MLQTNESITINTSNSKNKVLITTNHLEKANLGLSVVMVLLTYSPDFSVELVDHGVEHGLFDRTEHRHRSRLETPSQVQLSYIVIKRERNVTTAGSVKNRARAEKSNLEQTSILKHIPMTNTVV